MALKFSNNGTSTLASSITSSQTTLTLQAGTGARFPALAASDYFMATIVDTAGNMEIVRVTARSADTLTATRGQEGTLARAFDAGSYIANHLTAGQLATFFNTDNDGAGSGLDADLLDGLTQTASNTADTIVRRDGFGDFAARVITAQTFSGALNGNANTATTATNVSGGTASVTSLTNTGTSNLQGNVTLGTDTNNSHRVNGTQTVTGSSVLQGELVLSGILRANGVGYGTFVNEHPKLELHTPNVYAAMWHIPPGIAAVRLSTTGGSGVAGNAHFQIDSAANFSRPIPGGSTLYPDFACRAWVSFTGTGTVTIRGQGNVSSITDVDVGRYHVNFAVAMPDTNYAAHANSGRGGGASSNGDDNAVNIGGSQGFAGVYSTTQVSLSMIQPSGGFEDATIVTCSIFR